MILHPTPKINLGLNVVRKREDGFHDIETLFYPFRGICDTLAIDPAPELGQGQLDIAVTLNGKPSAWSAEDDLCARAYRVMAEKYGLGGVRIRLDKNIPIGAGLGGGSADCGATIKALDGIFGLNLSTEEMLCIAASLGSDCPFFIYDAPCFAEGRGEILTTSTVCLDDYSIELVIPEGVSVSTKEAYGGITPKVPQRSLRDILSEDVSVWKDSLHNDFEDTVFKLHPSLAEAKEALYGNGALYASMSGSGSALFGIFRK